MRGRVLHVRVASMAAFSLTEILLLVVVVVILGTVSMAALGRREGDQRTVATEVAMRTLHAAVARYQTVVGSRPASLDDLTREGVGGLAEPILSSDAVPVDGWGNPLRYYGKGREVRFKSAGPDGVYNTVDDVAG